MKHLVTLAAAIEIPTGLVLIFRPSLFTQLLFAADMSAPGNLLGPLAGFGLLALAIACWPSRADSAPAAPAVRALLAFSLLCAVYLAYRGISMDETDLLLWPAAAVHAVLGLLLLWFGWARGGGVRLRDEDAQQRLAADAPRAPGP